MPARRPHWTRRALPLLAATAAGATTARGQLPAVPLCELPPAGGETRGASPGSRVAYLHLDRLGNGLPALAPVAERLAGP